MYFGGFEGIFLYFEYLGNIFVILEIFATLEVENVVCPIKV